MPTLARGLSWKKVWMNSLSRLRQSPRAEGLKSALSSICLLRSMAMKSDLMIWRRVSALAEEALQQREVPVGCVVVDRCGKIIAEGRNRVNEECNATMHAERVAMEQIDFQGDDLTVFVSCEPCVFCADLLNQCGVKKVIFACRNDKFGGCGSVLKVNKFEAIFDRERESFYISLLQQFYNRSNPNTD